MKSAVGYRGPTLSRRAGIVLGVGLGAFFDGIVFHQILQWHSTGSAVLPPVTMTAMRRNMFWDGAFHVFAWAFTLMGVFMLLSDARSRPQLPTARQLAGQLLIGAGGFNIIEGIIDHHLLEIHHVRDLPAHQPLYDYVFLAIAGVGFFIAGLMLARQRHVRNA